MRCRWTAVGNSALALSLAACVDSVGPTDAELRDIVLDFCAQGAPVFFAVQNDGEAWTRVTPVAGNTFSFRAAPKVALAMTFDLGSQMFTDVYYTTAGELEPLSGIACTEPTGNKTLNGTVSNIATGGRAVVTMSGTEVDIFPPPNNFTLSGVADGPQDLLAHRDGSALGADFIPNWVIVRRTQNPTNNFTMSTLDFGIEGGAVATSTATITGLLSSEDNYFDILFSTALGTSHTLYQSPIFGGGPRTLYGVPSTFTQSGDVHEIVLNADATSLTSYRSLNHWYRNPSSKTLTLGAALNTPTVTSAASTPYARLRATLLSQNDYGSFATAYFIQPTRRFFVTVTAGYQGTTPAQWTLEMPDLTPAGGFPSTAGLQTGQTTDWFVEAYDGTLANFIGAAPTEGATVRFAGRASTTSTLQLSRTDGGRRARPTFTSKRGLSR